MGKKSPKPPPVPDPAAIASAQGAANKEAVQESARVSQINQVSPFGNLTFSGEVGQPDRTATTSLSANQQGLLSGQENIGLQLLGLAPELANNIQTGGVDFGGLSALPGIDDFSAERDRAEQASFDRQLALINPGLNEREENTRSRLASQGLPTGSEAFGAELDRLGRERTLNETIASQNAVQAGGAEQSRLFNLALGGRQQGINELLTQRSVPINEIAALLQGAPAVGTPGFQPTQSFGIAPPDILGANQLAQNAQLAQFGGSSQQSAGFNQGLGSLLSAGALIGGSKFF